MANVVIEVPTDHIDATGMTFMVYAKRYREAALACLNIDQGTEGFDPVPYYLLCLSLELHLKSFIWLKDGSGHKALKTNYGHDIEKLWRDSKNLGISKYAQETPLRNHVISLVGPYYRDRKFNYLDLEMIFKGYGNLNAEPRAIPTLRRLTDQLGKSLQTPIRRKR
jgi:hypothetical protein